MKVYLRALGSRERSPDCEPCMSSIRKRSLKGPFLAFNLSQPRSDEFLKGLSPRVSPTSVSSSGRSRRPHVVSWWIRCKSWSVVSRAYPPKAHSARTPVGNVTSKPIVNVGVSIKPRLRNPRTEDVMRQSARAVWTLRSEEWTSHERNF